MICFGNQKFVSTSRTLVNYFRFLLQLSQINEQKFICDKTEVLSREISISISNSEILLSGCQNVAIGIIFSSLRRANSLFLVLN